MIHSFVLSDGKLVGRDLEIEALRLVRADKGLVVWVDLDSPTDEEAKAVLEGVFQFHPVAIEDCLTPSSLPKIEEYEEYLFVVVHGVDFHQKDRFSTIELDLFVGKDYLVTFHRSQMRSVDGARERIAKATGLVARAPDRIAHVILDLLVDNYQPLVMELGAELEKLEENVLAEKVQKSFIPEMLRVRRDFSKLRQIIRPQREVIDRLSRGDSKLIRPLMLPYFRDLRDTLVRLDDLASGYHERLLLDVDIYLNKAGFEANEGIKFLTALTAVTLPTVLIGTWWGMNFENMPELHWRESYWWAWGVNLVLTLVMVLYLRKRKWF